MADVSIHNNSRARIRVGIRPGSGNRLYTSEEWAPNIAPELAAVCPEWIELAPGGSRAFCLYGPAHQLRVLKDAVWDGSGGFVDVWGTERGHTRVVDERVQLIVHMWAAGSWEEVGTEVVYTGPVRAEKSVWLSDKVCMFKEGETVLSAIEFVGRVLQAARGLRP